MAKRVEKTKKREDEEEGLKQKKGVGFFFCWGCLDVKRGDRKKSKVGRLRGDREKNGGLVLVFLVGHSVVQGRRG